MAETDAAGTELNESGVCIGKETCGCCLDLCEITVQALSWHFQTREMVQCWTQSSSGRVSSREEGIPQIPCLASHLGETAIQCSS